MPMKASPKPLSSHCDAMKHCPWGLKNDTPCDEFVVHMQGMRCGCTLQSFRHGVGLLSRPACCTAGFLAAQSRRREFTHIVTSYSPRQYIFRRRSDSFQNWSLKQTPCFLTLHPELYDNSLLSTQPPVGTISSIHCQLTVRTRLCSYIYTAKEGLDQACHVFAVPRPGMYH